jgi:hypothetical protein
MTPVIPPAPVWLLTKSIVLKTHISNRIVANKYPVRNRQFCNQIYHWKCTNYCLQTSLPSTIIPIESLLCYTVIDKPPRFFTTCCHFYFWVLSKLNLFAAIRLSPLLSLTLDYIRSVKAKHHVFFSHRENQFVILPVCVFSIKIYSRYTYVLMLQCSCKLHKPLNDDKSRNMYFTNYMKEKNHFFPTQTPVPHSFPFTQTFHNYTTSNIL